MTTTHMRRGSAALVAGLLTLGLAQSASAQAERLSLEGRIGTTLPIGDFADGGAEGGLGFEGEIMYTFNPNITAFAGYGWNGFSAEDGPDDPDLSGFQGGLKVIAPRPGSASPWARAELLYHRASVGDFESDRTLGFGAAVGVDVGVAQNFYLVPAVRFRTISPDADGVDLGDIQYFMIDLGAHFHIG